MTARDLFEQHLPAALATHRKAESAKGVGGCFGFVVGGQEGGCWLVNLAEPSVQAVQAGEPPHFEGALTALASRGALCRLALSAEDFAELLANPDAGMRLFFGGRLKIEGDVMAATKLPRLFALLKD